MWNLSWKMLEARLCESVTVHERIELSRLQELQSTLHFLSFLSPELNDFYSTLLEVLICQCSKLMRQRKSLPKLAILKLTSYSVLLSTKATLEKSKLLLSQPDSVKKAIERISKLLGQLQVLNSVKGFFDHNRLSLNHSQHHLMMGTQIWMSQHS